MMILWLAFYILIGWLVATSSLWGLLVGIALCVSNGHQRLQITRPEAVARLRANRLYQIFFGIAFVSSAPVVIVVWVVRTAQRIGDDLALRHFYRHSHRGLEKHGK